MNKTIRHISLFFALSAPFSVASFNTYAFDLNLNNLNVDKLISIAKKTQDLKPVDEKGEFEIGSGVAANLLVAAPGGYVFITKGLLLRLRSEAELAGVLSHEISHVLKKHHLMAIQKGAQTGLLADVASMAVEGNENSELAQKAIGAGTELYSRGLDKDDEFEADRMGVVIAARAGYDPYGLPAVLQTLESMNADDSNLALMFKTHPAPQKRLELLDAAMTGTLEKYATQVEGEERFVKVVGDYAKK